MSTHHLDPSSPLAQSMRSVTGYTRRAYKLRTVEPDAEQSYHAYWDGGSRTSYTFVNLDTWQAVPMPGEAANPFRAEAHGRFVLPFNVGVIEHAIFCGKDLGLTLVVRDDNATPMLPAPETLTPAQHIVLEHTRGLKASYGGIKDFRFTEANRRTGISKADWDTAKTALITSGHLNKAGAITIKGRNACA